jgi:hypothetical protein
MKTIFRSVNLAILLAAIVALGYVAQAQEPVKTPDPACTDTATMNDLDAKVRAAFADKTLAGRRNFVSNGKQFLEKFGGCDSQKEFVDWLKVKVPDTETKTIPDMEKAEVRAKLIKDFNQGVETKNYDQAYAAGKELLAKYPEEFRPIEVDLAAIGGEQALASNNLKYADDAIKYAKLSLADLEAGKPFLINGKTFIGSRNEFGFGDRKEQAIGWLNLYIGYLTSAAKKDKIGALPYLYKASLAPASADPKLPSASSRPVTYELVGDYYYEELGKLLTQIQTKIADQKDTDTPEVAKQKVEDIKATVAMANGYAERVMDAYGRAAAKVTDAKLKAALKIKIDKAYKVRFAKDTGSDAWVAAAIAKPFVNPQTPVTPIVEEPAGTTGMATGPGTGVGAANGTGVGAANGSGIGNPSGTGVGGANPANVSNPPKPAGGGTPPKPAKPTPKRQALVKKASAKKGA